MSSLGNPEPVGNHTVAGKDLSRTSRYLLVVVYASTGSVKTHAMAYFLQPFPLVFLG